MKTMSNYTIYCTEEQTKKALELGAPIEFQMERHVDLDTLEKSPYPDIKVGKDGELILIIPTAEQMIGWLRDQNIDCFVGKQGFARFMASVTTANWDFIYSKKIR